MRGAIVGSAGLEQGEPVGEAWRGAGFSAGYGSDRQGSEGG